MELKDKTLLEKDVMDNKKSKTLGLESESAAKLFSRFSPRLDINYSQYLQSSPSCKGSAYSYLPMIREKPFYTSAFDIACEKLMNPLGSIYDRLNNGRTGIGLPCDLGAMGGFGRM